MRRLPRIRHRDSHPLAVSRMRDASQRNWPRSPVQPAAEQSVPSPCHRPDPKRRTTLVGWLCLAKDDRHGARTVQLLVSGLTFDHNYWDTTYQPDTYSYVRAANKHGYSTFNIDRLGVGVVTARRRQR